MHLPVGEFLDFPAQKHAVRRHREAEFLVCLFLKRATVCNDLLDSLPGKQRFPAKKIDLKITPGSRCFHKKVQRFTTDLCAHESAVPVVFAFACKTVLTRKVAVMGDV